MKDDISKARQKKVSLQAKKSSSKKQKRPFRESNLLAIIYMLCIVGMTWTCMLWAYPKSMDSNWVLRLPAGVINIFVALLCTRLILGLIAPEVLKRNSRLLMLSLVAISSIALSAACVYVTQLLVDFEIFSGPIQLIAPFLFPYLLAPALATLLAGPSAGLAIGMGVMLANMIFIGSEAVLPTVVMGLVTSISTNGIVAKVYRRKALLHAFLLGGLIQFLGVLVYLAVKVAQSQTDASLLEGATFCAVATIASTALSFIAAIILLPIFEHIFAACSNIRLHEYTDLSSPILERLSLEAPGTYHHSVTVATLASKAAEEIGANALLARVGSYFHDIGKLTKPDFYTENMRGGESPHDKLSPNMSYVVIFSHVKEGIGLANHYNLPPQIRNIIKEHHGTSVMGFFLHKARELAKTEAEKTGQEVEPVDESQFRYKGPKPSTRESAIILLADCVEAASRSLERPTIAAIENLIQDIVWSKIEDGQLDQCTLSFLDITKIQRSFILSLSNIYHTRIAYPKDDEKQETQNVDQTKNGSPETEN